MNAAVPISREGCPPARFLSNSGRTVVSFDRAGMQQLAAEHEWLRDRVASLGLDNARLRCLIEATARPILCQVSPPEHRLNSLISFRGADCHRGQVTALHQQDRHHDGHRSGSRPRPAAPSLNRS